METQESLAGKTNEELLFEYKETKDLKIKQELTMRYVPIVKRVALQMRDVYASFSQVDDIINEGVLAIMTALDKFDPSMNVKFESYISKRIRGLVIDIARKQDWIPRGTRKIAKDIDNVTNTLYNQLGRFPSDHEIAEYLNISIEKFYDEQRKMNLFHILSLDMIMDESVEKNWSGSFPAGDPSTVPEQQYLDEEMKNHLKEGILKLRENERLVISLYYQHDVSIKEIAKIMKVSEPRISQIHVNAIKKLRKHMESF